MSNVRALISQLSLIPQVTEKISVEILKKYPTVVELISTYEDLPTIKQQNLLSDIKYNISNGKTRRIGKKISERIYNFFYGKL